MKNLKMFAIGLAAFAAMTMGVHAGSYNNLTCTEDTVDGQCTVSVNGTLTGSVDANKKVTIIGDGKTITLGAVTLEKNSTLEIKGAYVVLGSNTVTVKSGATLTITEAPKEASTVNTPALKITGGARIDVKDGGTLNVIGNKSYSAIVVTGSGNAIKLDKATLNVSDNRGNGMQGANHLTLTADGSTINVKNNTSNGLGATFVLEDTTINASGNGYAGVIFGSGSSIDETSHVNARGNLTATDDIVKQKADILLDNGVSGSGSSSVAATIDVEGFIDAGSIAPTKVTWTSSNAGKVSTGKLIVTGNNVKIDKTVGVCQDDGTNLVFSCKTANEITIEAATDEYAIVTIGDEARLYSKASNDEITLDKAYDNLVVMDEANMKKLTVVSGTVVTNETGADLVVYEVGADRPIVVPKAENGKDPVPVTVGVKAPEDQTNPGDQNTGDANTPADGTTGRLPDEPAKTNDNILVYASLSLVSALAVGFSAKRKENN